MLDPDIEVDLADAVSKLDNLNDHKKFKRVMRAVRIAGADVIRKHAYRVTSRRVAMRRTDKGWVNDGVGFRDKTGTLRESLRTKKGGVKTYGFKGYVFAAVGLGNQPSPHAHLIEFGHEGPRPSKPHPFMEHAAIEAADDSLKASSAKFVESVERQLTKK